ncbi:DNA repair protein RecO [Motiliproteus sp. MSK22-1]|uniref:DNA repair protein RecO n=1 Tax=Motiliproteus sp. MSK22-1 TaxID=1897630 RepID=UPI00097768A9|nr:DNA repair protein RecO [Motiliproteus sp. MSK22-1]OMH38126.1 DNA repair protein RecO [Motiliproteus sp. MSK22-1]
MLSSDYVEGQSAFVIHSRPYKESSFLVDYLTPDFGRIRGVVKGARRSSSKLRSSVQPFVPLELSWRGRGDLKSISRGDPAEAGVFLQGQSLWCGLYLNELVMRLLPMWDACPRLFAYYRFAVSSLDQPETLEMVLRVFERRLLEELGVAVSFQYSATGNERICANKQYWLDPAQGFVPTCESVFPSPDLRLYSGEVLLAIAADDYSEQQVQRDAKYIMRESLKPLLGNKALQSREFFKRSIMG